MPESRKTRLIINSPITLWDKGDYLFENVWNIIHLINDDILFICILKVKENECYKNGII